jgi:IMP dehydrogenase
MDKEKINGYFSETLSTTFDEYILLPGKTTEDCRVENVSLEGRLTNDLKIPLPFLSAAMQSVTGDELAIELALHGGLGVLPCGNVSVEEQIGYLRKMKKYRAGFVNTVNVSPEQTIKDVESLRKKFSHSIFPVVENGKLKGLITEKNYDIGRHADMLVSGRMLPLERLVTASFGIELEKAYEIITDRGVGVLPLVKEDGTYVCSVFWSDLKKQREYPDAFMEGKNKSLMVAGAVSTHIEDLERAEALAKEGADLFVIDASDGYSTFMEKRIKELKKYGLPIIAGNAVEEDAYLFLAKAGADAVKVGIGSGSICTTRRVKAIGRGQASAVIACRQARDLYFNCTGRYVPLISDGGVKTTADMLIAFALGADGLMMGNYFARAKESPMPIESKEVEMQLGGQPIKHDVLVKKYWGEASQRAKNSKRYDHIDPRTFIIEGEEGLVLYKGMLRDYLPKDVLAIKGGMSACGCKNLEEFHTKARIIRQSALSNIEGATSILKL